MIIDQKITNPKNYDAERPTSDIVYIVIQSLKNKPTGHYHVANGKAVQVIPDKNISNSVNGGQLNRMGRLHGICTKYNSITICVPEKPSKADLEVIPHLVMTIKRRYKISKENIIRQKDITGELNPMIWVDDDKWQRDIINALADME